MNVLALCAGVGGIELGLRLAEPSARTVCYVEMEAYAAAVLVARMASGELDEAPIWSDLATFDGRPWRGVVDCVTAGFPCQPFSVAGKRKRLEDERWIWPDIARIIREVGPEYVFLENVPGIIQHGLGAVLADLAQIGFDAQWGTLSAGELGAWHLRERVWILAHARRERTEGFQHESGASGPEADAGNGGENAADAQSQRLKPCGSEADRWAPAYAPGAGLSYGLNRGFLDATQTGNEALAEPERRDGSWWAVEPDLVRVVHGLPNRVDRIRALGNGVVPIVAAEAWRRLTARLEAK